MVSLQVQLQTQSVASANWQTPHAMHMHAVLFDYRTVRYILIGCPAIHRLCSSGCSFQSRERHQEVCMPDSSARIGTEREDAPVFVASGWLDCAMAMTQKTWQHSISPALSLKSIHAQMFHDKWQSHEPHAVMQPARTVWMNALGSVC